MPDRPASQVLVLNGGRRASLGIELADPEQLTFEFDAVGDPLRLAMDWDRRSDERLAGLGLRHATTLDQAGRDVQLGADRVYTGPDWPPEMLQDGGIPQGDCAPSPWLNSSRGYAVWCETDANGTRFEMAGERIAVSTRSAAGPLRLHLLTSATPLARLRALCRLTGFPALLPEWASASGRAATSTSIRTMCTTTTTGFAATTSRLTRS